MEKPVTNRPTVRHDSTRKGALHKLKRAMTEFAKMMGNKMEKKAMAGFKGWDIRHRKMFEQMHADLLEHADRAPKDPEQYIDVAIYAMFCWVQNLEEERRERLMGMW